MSARRRPAESRCADEAARVIGREWKIGSAGAPGDPSRNRGLLILYVPDRTSVSGHLRIEVGKGLSNAKWTIAMARTSDPNSATSQFFINLADNSGSLDPSPVFGPGYAVFGSVARGTATIDAMIAAPCSPIPLFLPSGECTPLPNLVVTSALQSK